MLTIERANGILLLMTALLYVPLVKSEIILVAKRCKYIIMRWKNKSPNIKYTEDQFIKAKGYSFIGLVYLLSGFSKAIGFHCHTGNTSSVILWDNDSFGTSDTASSKNIMNKVTA